MQPCLLYVDLPSNKRELGPELMDKFVVSAET